eukprot:CAMPEP_0197598428 /NCGR_PEP_ID=MMETSP1326-20131121/29313_1 /TAXON_ID=1155430 /ORGANISM="Genus nov. species nov., Strain RCC2288" /LENGTH=60 /DNA_ID=CAMNT_0043165227 /DNA_START=58 /DNA_END=240 /DNA_ORIENTATION=-
MSQHIIPYLNINHTSPPQTETRVSLHSNSSGWCALPEPWRGAAGAETGTGAVEALAAAGA